MACVSPFLHKIRIQRNAKKQKHPPARIGEYYIVRRGKIYYIGKTVDLNRRMQEHIASGKLRKGDIFYYRFAGLGSSQDELAQHECKMIAKYNPPGNKSKGGEGRMKNKTKYWLLSGGLQLLVIRIVITAIILLAIFCFLNTNGLLEKWIPEIQNLLQSLQEYLTKFLRKSP